MSMLHSGVSRYSHTPQLRRADSSSTPFRASAFTVPAATHQSGTPSAFAIVSRAVQNPPLRYST